MDEKRTYRPNDLLIHPEYGPTVVLGYTTLPGDNGDETFLELRPSRGGFLVYLQLNRLGVLREPVSAEVAEGLWSILTDAGVAERIENVEMMNDLSLEGSLEEQIRTLRRLYALSPRERAVTRAIARLEASILPELACALRVKPDALKNGLRAIYPAQNGAPGHVRGDGTTAPSAPRSLTFLCEQFNLRYVGHLRCGEQMIIGDLFAGESWWKQARSSALRCTVATAAGLWHVFTEWDANDDAQLYLVHEHVSPAMWTMELVEVGTFGVDSGCLGAFDATIRNDIFFLRLSEQSDDLSRGDVAVDTHCCAAGTGGDGIFPVYANAKSEPATIVRIGFC